MATRKIIKINAEKCNGCGLCIPNCPEGAIQIIDEKARLISDLFCDGLGACIGHCPEGAITIEEREAKDYDEKKVMENIVKQGQNVIKAHLEHLKGHNQSGYLNEALDFLKERKIEVDFREDHAGDQHEHSGCPGSKVMQFARRERVDKNKVQAKLESQLRQWPIQIKLIPAIAPFLNNADILIAADCVPFTYADFHEDLLKGKVLLVGCPKLDDLDLYQDKITQMLKNNDVKTITYAHMEVPCCFGLVGAIKTAISEAGKNIPFEEVVISIKGDRLQ
ncbi:MAG: 4Fe-4S binding protein [Candidatus Omnitrophica bacterium]|nr:4Fe-4S binding protein [Candidatus Omnitrophota bacterium]MBU1905858.1 4Fe-4S binding protein [Candidatus Omnitrophota bacterium]